MKKSILFIAGMAIFATSAVLSAIGTAHAAESPRLALWVTDTIGMGNGDKCVLPPASALPLTAPTVTEADVTLWNPENARWTLSTERFPVDGAGQKLQDHCFVLAIDGKLLSSGIVLSSYSARLTGFPTISVYSQNSQNNTLYLQLTSGNHGSHTKLIHVDALNAALHQPANLTHQLQRIADKDAAFKMQEVGDEWARAVQQLIDQKIIREGMSYKEMVKLIGQATIYPHGYSGRYSWRFDTPRHVNPVFSAEIMNDVVINFRLEQK